MLIDEYQNHPCLYAVKSPHYKNKHVRQKSLKAIEASLRKTKSHISQHDIKIKWNGLRNNFFNERRKVRNSKVSGAGESEVK
jgi:translation initiation factor IF-3